MPYIKQEQSIINQMIAATVLDVLKKHKTKFNFSKPNPFGSYKTACLRAEGFVKDREISVECESDGLTKVSIKSSKFLPMAIETEECKELRLFLERSCEQIIEDEQNEILTELRFLSE